MSTMVILISIVIGIIFLNWIISSQREPFVANYQLTGDIANYVPSNDIDVLAPSAELASVRDLTTHADQWKLCRDYTIRTCQDTRAYDRFLSCSQGQMDKCMAGFQSSLIQLRPEI